MKLIKPDSLSSALEEESLLDESESEDATSSLFCAMIILGADFKCSLKSSLKQKTNSQDNSQHGCRESHVSPPKPIEVKKFILKRVFLGLSRGIRPSKYPHNVLSKRITI